MELFVATDIGKSVMAAIYLLLEEDGGLPLLFFDRTPDIDEFIGWLHQPGSKYLGCFARPCPTLDDPNPKPEIAGIGILWDIKGPLGARRATANMAFRRGFQRSGMPAQWTEQMLAYCFGPLQLDVLYGFTPVVNKASLRFCRRLGFEQTPPLPKYGTYQGDPCDCIISFLTRERWEEHP